MELKNKVLSAVTAAVLTVGATGTALALENEFHGMYRVDGISSNFDNGGAPDFYSPAGNSKSPQVNTYVEQRIRLKYSAKVDDNFKLMTDFKIDSVWGNGSYGTKRKLGGEIGSDTVNIETRAAYIDFKVKDVKVKAGIQAWEDAYDGIFADTQMAGALASTKFDKLDLALGWFRLDESAANPFGHHPRDLVVLEGSYPLGENLTVGASYYLLNDDATSVTNYLKQFSETRTLPTEMVHTLGVNSQAKIGPAEVNGYLLYQFGNLDDFATGQKRDISAFAAGAGAKSKFGFGTLKASLLYASGDKNSGGAKAFRDVEDLDGGTESDYSSDLRILRKDMYTGPSGNAIAATVNFHDQGLFCGTVGIDTEFTPKFFGGANVGFAAVAEKNVNTPKQTNGKYLGTEINAAIGYKFNANVTLRLREAYAILGDYYKGTATNGDTPSNLFLSNIMLTYTF